MHIEDKSAPALNYSESDQAILDRAANIISEKYVRHGVFTSPEATKQFFSYRMAHHEQEVFGVMLLDNQHRLIEFKELFFGTIDSAAVYPREVLSWC